MQTDCGALSAFCHHCKSMVAIDMSTAVDQIFTAYADVSASTANRSVDVNATTDDIWPPT